MICPNCGSNNPDGAGFCPNCGKPLPANAIPPVQPNPTPQQPSNSAPIPPNNYGGAGIPQRNLALCIILSFVTCGIYGLYWLYTLTEDVNKLTGDPNATSGGIVILLSLVTCGIYSWYWLYKQGERLDQIKTARGIASSNSGVLYLVLGIVGLSIVSWALMQNELNKLAG